MRRWLILAALLLVPVAGQAQTIEYYGLDAVGSVRVVFDANGNVLSRADYAPFGEPLFSATGKQQQVYAGLFAEGEAGFDYAEARMYQPRTGRFNTVDPVYAGLFQPQAWNRYAYALSRPGDFVDATGLQAQATRSCAHQQKSAWDEKTQSFVLEQCNDGAGGGNIVNWLFTFIGDFLSGTSAVLEAPGTTPDARHYRPSRRVEVAATVLAIAATVVTGRPGATSGAVAGAEAAVAEQKVVVKAGTILNRVWDSRYTPGSQYSRPLGLSYTPGGFLPTNSSVAIADRGLNFPGILNDARYGALFEVTSDVPAMLRMSIGGSAELVYGQELKFGPDAVRYLQLIPDTVSILPHGPR